MTNMSCSCEANRSITQCVKKYSLWSRSVVPKLCVAMGPTTGSQLDFLWLMASISCSAARHSGVLPGCRRCRCWQSGSRAKKNVMGQHQLWCRKAFGILSGCCKAFWDTSQSNMAGGVMVLKEWEGLPLDSQTFGQLFISDLPVASSLHHLRNSRPHPHLPFLRVFLLPFSDFSLGPCFHIPTRVDLGHSFPRPYCCPLRFLSPPYLDL